jgi:hypothetical protein
VDLEPGLGEIKTNGGNLHGGRLLSCGAFSDDDSLAHRSRRAGAVHPFKKYSRAAGLLFYRDVKRYDLEVRARVAPRRLYCYLRQLFVRQDGRTRYFCTYDHRMGLGRDEDPCDAPGPGQWSTKAVEGVWTRSQGS